MRGALDTAYFRVILGICIATRGIFANFFNDGNTKCSSSVSFSKAGFEEDSVAVEKKFQR